jgi:hypothetical protein
MLVLKTNDLTLEQDPPIYLYNPHIGLFVKNSDQYPLNNLSDFLEIYNY